eukprot:TRINITY_DN8299_c0_g6_i1.p1 TRINITY_DN8299_c0_g6~~TRINITY_DN8299_c0_g6_i1.p1  ORF type:complete len:507 (+),score=86.56 TRINITY_DN8299_c0_g6_i1:81-1601(+)
MSGLLLWHSACGTALWQKLARDSSFEKAPDASATVIQARLWCARELAVWSVVMVPVLVGLFWGGSNWYECGKPWLYTTAAYLYDNRELEVAVAVVLCAGAAAAGWLIRRLECQVRDRLHECQGRASRATWWQWAAIWAAWAMTTLVLSIPTALYVAATTLPPGDNTLGLSRFTLGFFEHAGGPILYGVSALLVPPLARLLARTTVGQDRGSHLAVRLMLVARLLVALVIPFALVLALNQECHALWLRLWEPCHVRGSFDVFVPVPVGIVPMSHTNTYSNQKNQVLQRDDVCHPPYRPHGECPRAVVAALGKLLLDKILFAACVGPFRSLLVNAAVVRGATEWVARNVFRQTDYELKIELDAEAAGVVMLLELALVFGFAVPLLLPVTALAFWLHAIAFQVNVRHQGSSFNLEATPPVKYLWFSLLLGVALVAWMFVECGWAGRWLILVGMPAGAALGGVIGDLAHRRRVVQLEMLAEPLLDGVEEAAGLGLGLGPGLRGHEEEGYL